MNPTKKQLEVWIKQAFIKARSRTFYPTSFYQNAMKAVARIAYREGFEHGRQDNG